MKLIHIAPLRALAVFIVLLAAWPAGLGWQKFQRAYRWDRDQTRYASYVQSLDKPSAAEVQTHELVLRGGEHDMKRWRIQSALFSGLAILVLAAGVGLWRLAPRIRITQNAPS